MAWPVGDAHTNGCDRIFAWQRDPEDRGAAISDKGWKLALPAGLDGPLRLSIGCKRFNMKVCGDRTVARYVAAHPASHLNSALTDFGADAAK